MVDKMPCISALAHVVLLSLTLHYEARELLQWTTCSPPFMGSLVVDAISVVKHKREDTILL